MKPRQRSNGTWIVQFSWNSRRTQIALGKVSESQANQTASMLTSLLEVQRSQTSLGPELNTWLQSIPSALATRLFEIGLIKNQHRDLTLGQLVDIFLESYDESAKVSEETKKVKRTSLNRLPDFARETKLRDITPKLIEDIENYTLGDDRWVLPTVGRTHGDFLHVGNWAVKHNYAKSNPFEGLTRYATDNQESEKYINEEIVRQVINVCPSSDLRALFALARFGGLRIPSEVMQLTWNDGYLPDEGVLVVRKSKQARTKRKRNVYKVIPLWPYLDQILTEHWEETAEKSPTIITSSTLRTTATAIRQRAARAIRRAQHEPWPKLWQNLRHSYAQDVRKLFGVEEGAAMTGHSPQVALRNYQTDQSRLVDVSQAIKSGIFPK